MEIIEPPPSKDALPRPMWLEKDGSRTFMSRTSSGAFQCFSNDIDPLACGLNLAGPFGGTEAIPAKIISEDLSGSYPFSLVWSDGALTNLSFLNGIFLKRILKVRRGLKINWRPDPGGSDITFSFTIPLERTRSVRKKNH